MPPAGLLPHGDISDPPPEREVGMKPWWQLCLAEAIGTFALVFDILAGGPLTGAAMNPVRAFGPALMPRGAKEGAPAS